MRAPGDTYLPVIALLGHLYRDNIPAVAIGAKLDEVSLRLGRQPQNSERSTMRKKLSDPDSKVRDNLRPAPPQQVLPACVFHLADHSGHIRVFRRRGPLHSN